MDLWYTEEHTPGVRFSIQVDRQLYTAKSKFQRIDVFQSGEFGTFLTLDGQIMLTQNDEFIYHDMIVHVPMATRPEIKARPGDRGGGRGTVRETHEIRPPSKQIDVRPRSTAWSWMRAGPHLPQNRRPRSTITASDWFFEDGLRFVRTRNDVYDLIIVDSTDPFGPGEGLFTKEF